MMRQGEQAKSAIHLANQLILRKLFPKVVLIAKSTKSKSMKGSKLQIVHTPQSKQRSKYIQNTSENSYQQNYQTNKQQEQEHILREIGYIQKEKEAKYNIKYQQEEYKPTQNGYSSNYEQLNDNRFKINKQVQYLKHTMNKPNTLWDQSCNHQITTRSYNHPDIPQRRFFNEKDLENQLSKFSILKNSGNIKSTVSKWSNRQLPDMHVSKFIPNKQPIQKCYYETKVVMNIPKVNSGNNKERINIGNKEKINIGNKEKTNFGNKDQTNIGNKEQKNSWEKERMNSGGKKSDNGEENYSKEKKWVERQSPVKRKQNNLQVSMNQSISLKQFPVAETDSKPIQFDRSLCATEEFYVGDNTCLKKQNQLIEIYDGNFKAMKHRQEQFKHKKRIFNRSEKCLKTVNKSPRDLTDQETRLLIEASGNRYKQTIVREYIDSRR